MTPFASDWEFDFAKTAVENEQLGQRGVTDLLAISISAPDLAGHDFGPMSHEVQDIVVRTDQQIGDFRTGPMASSARTKCWSWCRRITAAWRSRSR